MAHAAAERIVRALLENIVQEQRLTTPDYHLAPLSSCGANYTSHLYLATISQGKTKLDLFAKVAAIGEKLRTEMPMKLYENEIYFYTDLLKTYRKLEEKNNVPEEHRLNVPQFFGCREELYEETIVLENLTSKGYTTHDRFKSIDWDYAASAIEQLAKFHALSLAHQADDPDGSGRILEKLKFEILGDEDQMKAFWDNVVGKAVDATREENKGKLKVFFETLGGRDKIIELYSAGRRTVLGHGDYRPSNLMHRRREDGTLEVIAVDYQTIRGGSPVVDLYYFIFTGTDAKFRAQYHEKLLEHYYSELSAAMKRLGLDPDEKYSKQDYEAELKEKLPFGLAVAVFSLPIVTVEAENAPKVDENLELADFSIQKTGSLFPERLNGVVDDYVRWGVI